MKSHRQLMNELIDAEALALMEDDFLNLESMVLEGVSINELANSVDISIQVTGLKDIDGIELAGFSDVSSSELFDPSLLPNTIQIFEGEESYAFALMTQAFNQPFSLLLKLLIRPLKRFV